MEQGLYVEAIGQLNQALKLRKSGKIDASKLDILAYRAEAEFKMEDYVAAENTYLLISDLDENKMEYIDMAVVSICRGSKDLDEAKELYEITRTAQQDSNAHKFARDELVKLIRAQGGDMDEALSYYREYMEETEMNPRFENCLDIAENLINDVRWTETRTKFIQDILNWSFNKDRLDQVIDTENDNQTIGNIKILFETAQELDPEELKDIYDNLIGFDEYPESIDERKHFTSKKIIAELTDEFDEE